MQCEDGRSIQRRQTQGFIPGLPNEIVLEHIATKVPWRSMYTLATVSQEWRTAIRSREIYKVRKLSGASQSMVVTSVRLDKHDCQGFFDVENQDLFVFPRPKYLQTASYLPSTEEISRRGPLQACTSDDGLYTASWVVFLDAKMYALREIRLAPTSGLANSWRQNVLVLDIGACDRVWRHCSSSTIDNRTEMWVACNGRIYSFHTCQERFHGKVFDPINNEWTEIEDRPIHKCPTFLHDMQPDDLGDYGDQFGKDYRNQVAVLNKEIYVGRHWVEELMVFNSVTQKWRSIPNTVVTIIEKASLIHVRLDFNVAVIRDKLYTFSDLDVRVYNPESNSWTLLQQTSNQAFKTDELYPHLHAKTFSCNEVVGLLQWGYTRRLCKSTGFGVKGDTLVWKNIPGFSFKNCLNFRTGLLLSHLEV